MVVLAQVKAHRRIVPTHIPVYVEVAKEVIRVGEINNETCHEKGQDSNE